MNEWYTREALPQASKESGLGLLCGLALCFGSWHSYAADQVRERELIQDPSFRCGFRLVQPEPGKRVVKDYRIANLNLGWEVPGIFDVELQIRRLNLKVIYGLKREFDPKPEG